MVFFFETDQNKRSENEDSFSQMEIRLNHEATVSVMAVADGMGGLSGGKMYARTAIKLWYKELMDVLLGDNFQGCSLCTQFDTLKEFSEQIFQKINQMLYRKGIDQGIKGGTTLTTAIHFYDTWIVSNCGDSPAYAFQKGQCVLISEIQNMAWQMVREGRTQRGTTIFYQNKNKLVQFLGRREVVHPYVNVFQDGKYDALILGTDGAFGDITDKKLAAILKNVQTKDDVLTRLFEYVKESGEEDNQTAILCVDREKKQSVIETGLTDIQKGYFNCLDPEKVVSLPEEEEGTEGLYQTIQKDTLQSRLRRYLNLKK